MNEDDMIDQFLKMKSDPFSKFDQILKNAISKQWPQQMPQQNQVYHEDTGDSPVTFDEMCVDQAYSFMQAHNAISKILAEISYNDTSISPESMHLFKKLKILKKTIKVLDKDSIKKGMDLITCQKVMNE